MKLLLLPAAIFLGTSLLAQDQDTTAVSFDKKVEQTCACFSQSKEDRDVALKSAKTPEEGEKANRNYRRARMKCFKLQHDLSQTVEEGEKRKSFLVTTNGCAD